MEDDDDVDVVDHDENDEDVPVIDPRVFVQVESEIELPADILNCVEKLGSLGGVDFFHNNLSASVDDVEIQDFAEKGEQVVVERAENGVKINSLEGQNRLQLLSSPSSQEPAGLSSEVEEGKNNNHHNQQQQENNRPSSVTMPNKSSDKSFYGLRSANTASQHEDNTTINYNRSNFKRRRGSDSHSNTDHHENLTDSATDVSVSNLAKRLRISNAANVIQESSSSRTTFNNNNNNNNIINKEQQGWEVAESESMKHDRRVPSNPSSTPASSPTKKTNNSSDEENDQPDSMMEVDQITSLVQYFSFSQQQHSSSTNDSSKSSNPSSASSPPRLGGGSSSTASSSSSSNLIRSVSSPDLCSSNHRCVVVTT